MQVNPPANQQNPANETSAIKSAEKTDKSSANAFLSYIGPILDLDDKNGLDPAEEQCCDDPTVTVGDIPMSMLPGVLAPSAKAADAGTEVTTSDSGPSDLPGDDKEIANTTTAIDVRGIAVPNLSIAAETRITLAPIADSEKKIDENRQTVQNPSFESADVRPDVALDSRVSGISSQAGPIVSTDARDLPEEEQPLKSFNVRIETVAKKSDAKAPALSDRPDIRDVRTPLDRSRSELLKSGQEGAELNIPLPKAVAPDFLKESTSKSDLSAASGKADFAETLALSRNSDAQKDISAAAGLIKEMETMGLTVSENQTAADAHADRDAPRNPSIAWSAFQSKLESGQLNSAKPQTSDTGEKQEVFSVHLPSDTARGVGSSNSVGSSTETISTTQPKDFTLQVAERIQFQVREGKGEIRIQLQPESLGRMEISAETGGNGVIARITTESNSVKSYLENNVHILQQALQDQGLKVDHISISVNESPSFSSGYGAQFSRNGSEQSGKEYHDLPEVSGSMATDALEDIFIDPMTLMAINPGVHFYAIA
jgi:flagellar hook-length control protein FliK